MSVHVVGALLGAAALAALSCSVARYGAEQVGSIPGLRTPAKVSSVVERGGYLDATLESKYWSFRFYFPDHADCRAIVRPGEDVTYVKAGSLGQVQNPAREVCDPVGIASLREWRDQRPRSRLSEPLPRTRADFEIIYRDEELAFARGRFLLAREIGWPGGDDTIALLPIAEGCQEPLERGVAAMEYRSAGEVPFRLVAGGEDCPILGFVQPLPARR
jgi:hypothetical protein